MDIKRLTVIFAGASGINEKEADVMKVTKSFLDYVFNATGRFEPNADQKSVILSYCDVKFPEGFRLKFNASMHTYQADISDELLAMDIAHDQLDATLTRLYENTKMNVLAVEHQTGAQNSSNGIMRTIFVAPKF